jgi:hypothetical protein
MAAKINLRTGKIIGAEKGSFAFLHEEGHIVYDDSEEGITNGVNQNMGVYSSLIFLVFGQWFFLFQLLALFAVGYVIWLAIYEEFWCNRYASNKINISMKGGKKQKTK